MTKNLSMTEVARMAQSQRTLALKQQDAARLSGLPLLNDDDSHLDLTTRIRFLEACGGPPPYVLERIDKSGNVDRSPFERPFLIAGRSPACDVACQDRSVSYRHVYFQHVNGVVWWFDLDSRSGVISGGKKRRAGCLLPGMTVTAGDYFLRLADASEDLPQGRSPAGTGHNTLCVAQHPDMPQVALEFENGKVGSEGKALWPIENSITLLGRRSCCDLRFADESVSRVHASLVLTKEGLWIIDLLGRGGTKVNGLLSAYAYLHDGSLIEIGKYRIRVKYADAQKQPHPAEAVLNEDDRPARRRSGAAGGSVSEDLLYDLVTNMAEMQKQMFEQSQMQIGLMVQLLGSIHQSQQDMLRNELNRVNEISQEIHELQLRLNAQDSASQSPALESSRTEALPPTRPPEPKRDQDESEAEDIRPAPRLSAQDAGETEAELPEESAARPKSKEVHDHAVLFQRMQSLDRERNSRLQKIFRAFRSS